jgi:hypothetical protein
MTCPECSKQEVLEGKLAGRYLRQDSFFICAKHGKVWSEQPVVLDYAGLDNLMCILATPISVKEAAAMLGMPEKTIHNRKGGTAKLTRIKQGRSTFLIKQEVELHIERLIRQAKRGVK